MLSNFLTNLSASEAAKLWKRVVKPWKCAAKPQGTSVVSLPSSLRLWDLLLGLPHFLSLLKLLQNTQARLLHHALFYSTCYMTEKLTKRQHAILSFKWHANSNYCSSLQTVEVCCLLLLPFCFKFPYKLMTFHSHTILMD